MVGGTVSRNADSLQYADKQPTLDHASHSESATGQLSLSLGRSDARSCLIDIRHVRNCSRPPRFALGDVRLPLMSARLAIHPVNSPLTRI